VIKLLGLLVRLNLQTLLFTNVIDFQFLFNPKSYLVKLIFFFKNIVRKKYIFTDVIDGILFIFDLKIKEYEKK